MTALQDAGTLEQAAKVKVLVMEDEANMARALEMVLSEEGYEVDVAMTGRNAMKQLDSKTFDLLLADLRLPDINGMDVIKKVKHDQPDTEVVVITGYSTVSSAVEAIKLGAFDYLAKPFTEDEIKGVISSALKNRGEAPAQEARQDQGGSQTGALIQRQEVLNVLNRANEDDRFWKKILQNGTEALKDYALTTHARAAILSGDLEWLKENLGNLTEEQLMLIHRRNELEAW
ncbi:MAG: response regulator [Syntrophobacteraceae bacterium]